MRKIGLVGNLVALGFLFEAVIENRSSLSGPDWKQISVIGLVALLLAFNIWHYLRPALPTKRKWWISSFLERIRINEEIRIVEAKKRLESLNKS